MFAAELRVAHEADVLEHAQVSGHRLPGHAAAVGQRGDRLAAPGAQPVHEHHARRVAERGKDRGAASGFHVQPLGCLLARRSSDVQRFGCAFLGACRLDAGTGRPAGSPSAPLDRVPLRGTQSEPALRAALRSPWPGSPAWQAEMRPGQWPNKPRRGAGRVRTRPGVAVKWSHIVLSTVGRMPLFSKEEDRRRALRKVAEVIGPDLVLFTFVDDHLHLVVSNLLASAGRYAQAVRLALAVLPGFAPLQPTWIGEIATRGHAETLLGYTLGQSAKHKLPGHPARWSGSSLADLAGARQLEGFDPKTITGLLPRFRIEDALRAVGARALVVPDAAAVRALGAAAIAEAGAAAYAACGLAGREPASVAARRAAAAVQRDVGIPAVETAFSLGVTLRAAYRMHARAVVADGAVLLRRLALDAATRSAIAR